MFNAHTDDIGMELNYISSLVKISHAGRFVNLISDNFFNVDPNGFRGFDRPNFDFRTPKDGSTVKLEAFDDDASGEADKDSFQFWFEWFFHGFF